jgi:uncharacterized protein YcfJ
MTMRNKIAIFAMAAMLSAPMAIPAPAQAATYTQNGKVYHGKHRHYRHRCGGGNGAVGTVAGGVGGAVIGNAIGGGVLGTVAGGVGGALLGRHLDKSHTRHRNGC